MAPTDPRLSSADLGRRAAELLTRGELDTVVLATGDFNGVLRGKFLAADEFARDPLHPATIGDMVFVFDPADGVPLDGPEQGWWPFGAEGFRDLRMLPDPATFRLVPWAQRTGLVLCDFEHSDGATLEVDPRSVLRRVLDRAAAAGFAVEVGYELEFYVLLETAASLRAKRWQDLDYRAVRPFAWAIERGLSDEGLIRALRTGLEAFGLPVESWTSEGGAGQQELNCPHTDAMTAADRALLHRFAVRSIAEREGELATFMARVPGQEYGSSMHLHQSLWTTAGANAMHDPRADDGLSAECRSYIAGQLATLPELTCMLAPTINSYKRLRPWASAGVDLTWGFENWSTTLRVMAGSENATRVEHRTAGADANPYLAMAATIAGGLHGIEHGLQPPEPVSGPGYEAGAGRVPRTLEQALTAFEASPLAHEWFGEQFVAAYAATRRAEIEAFAESVTVWEVERYLEAT
jgi:glutamine synthetase